MYQVLGDSLVKKIEGGSIIPLPANESEGWIYEEWLKQGNVPQPAYVPSKDLKAIIASRRYQAEVAGIVMNGLEIATDDRSKLLINGAALESMIDPSYVMQWKTGDSFVSLNGSQIIIVAQAVRAHVQACFDREADLLAALANNNLTESMIEQGWP